MESKEIKSLMEAYASVYAQQEEEQLDEAGLPYGPVGKGFKKLPAGKKRAAMMKRADQLRTQAMKDDGDGGKGSPRGKMGEINAALTNPRLREETDLFDYILEHLVVEGYADTNEAALAIMANMSEEWRQSILDEGYKDLPRGKMYNKMINVRMHGRGEGYTPETQKMIKVSQEHKPEEAKKKEKENRERGGRG
jgi:hypothetical protein